MNARACGHTCAPRERWAGGERLQSEKRGKHPWADCAAQGVLTQLRLAGFEPCPRMRPITKRLARGLAAAAKRTTHFHTLLSKLVVQAQAAAEGDRPVLDARERKLTGALRRGNFRGFRNFTRVQKFLIQVLIITSGLGFRVPATAKRQVVGILNRAVIVHQREITRELQRARVGNQ